MQKEHEILSNKFLDNTFHILKTNVFALELSKFQSFRYKGSQNWDFFFIKLEHNSLSGILEKIETEFFEYILWITVLGQLPI